MKYLIFSALFMTFNALPAEAQSICYNNFCGELRCQFGCVQRVQNGRCVENRCIGGHLGFSSQQDGADLEETEAYEDVNSLRSPGRRRPGGGGGGGGNDRCYSCAGRDCYGGNTFLQAEAACKRVHSFGCFTRCSTL